MKKSRSVGNLLLSVLIVISLFTVQIPIAKAEGEPPGQVINVRATPYPCAVYLTWDPVEGATSYKIPGMDEIITESTSAWVHGFSPESYCEFQVIACNSYGEGMPSEILTVETIPLPPYPSKVMDFEVLETTSGDLYSTAKIRFEQVTDAMRYYLKISTNSDMSNARNERISISVDGICEFEWDIFAPETTYYIQVVSENEDASQDMVWSTLSDMIFFTTPAPLYPVLEETTAELRSEYFESGPDNVTLAWSLLNGASGTEWGNVSMFRLYYSESSIGINEEDCQYVNVPVSAWVLETYVLTGLNPSTTYYFKVMPYNSLGYGIPSEVASITTAEDLRPGQVQNVQATPYPTAVYLTWDPVEGATSYIIPTGMESITTDTNSAWFHGLSPDDYFELQVAAVNSYGEGVPSEPIVFNTLPLPQYPSKITNFEVLGTSPGEITITAFFRYEQVPDASEYYVKYSTSLDMSEAGEVGLGIWSNHIREVETGGFSPETTYYVQIVAENNVDDNFWRTPSDIVTFTTPAPMYPPEDKTVYFRNDYFDSGSDWVTIACTSDNFDWFNISGLRLYYSESPYQLGEEYQFIDMTVSGSGIKKTHTLTGLTPSTTYYFRILPYNSLGFGVPSEIASITTTAPEGISTPEGTSVKILDPVSSASLTFDNVTGSGITTVKQLSTPPDDAYFHFDTSCGYFDIETTATFDGAVRIILPYDASQISGLESDLRLYQFKDGQPIDITESVDTETNTITGIVTDHFCAFAIGIPTKSTVTFDSQGGSLVNSIFANYNTTITEPTKPTRTGYTLSGWYKDPECTTEWNFAVNKVVEDIVLYAKWLPNTDTVFIVEHYQQNFSRDAHILWETEYLEGSTDTLVAAIPKIYSGFYENTTHLDRIAEGIIAPNGSLVLKLYYNRDPYDFTGFFQPVDMNGVLNVVKAGSSIPIKFSLGGDMGLNIFQDGYPKVYDYYPSQEQTADVIETITYSKSGLTYDPILNQYTYVWKTDKAWAGTCKKLLIKFRDGTVRVAYFKFK